MSKEAEQRAFRVSSVFNCASRRDDPSSVLLTITGEGSAQFANEWIGTIKWSCPSPFRSNHKRQNWFVGVFRLQSQDFVLVDINPSDLKFDCFRAGGPGGQHQNTTDSAVRVTHLPTGVSAVSRQERSQHRNKVQAIEKLKDVFFLNSLQKRSDEKKHSHDLHKTLERGNPVRCFKGPKFKEV
jgi:peptide chain release factor